MLPLTESPKLIRTDFSHEKQWLGIVRAVTAPQGKDAFLATIDVINNLAFQGADVKTLLGLVDPSDEAIFLIVANTVAMTSPDQRLTVVDLRSEPGRSFLALPATIQVIENNLSVGNLWFHEFADLADARGIFDGS